MTLLCLGYRAAFELETGKFVHPPVKHALLYGEPWPKCSVLVAPFEHANLEPDRSSKRAAKWFGSSYDVKQGSIALPHRSLSDWTEVGPVARIYYVRGGEHEGEYEHQFGSAASIALSVLFQADAFSFKEQYPILFRTRSLFRLELGDGCVVDQRGFVTP